MGAERGQMLSHYRLVEKNGEGGMGVMWKAEDTVLHRTVAVKVLPTDLALDEKRRGMFLDEARLAASVSHGNIVHVFELGREGDLDFIVMEYVDGQPLSKLLRGKPLAPGKVADWGLQVAKGRATLRAFVDKQLLTPEDADSMLTWEHSGFHVHHAVRLEARQAASEEVHSRFTCSRPPRGTHAGTSIVVSL